MPKSNHLNNILNIRSNLAFLPNLSAWILQEYGTDFALADLTILLPSRRSCLEVKKCFLAAAKNEAMILPKIIAIGDVDYDEMLLENLPSQNISSKLEYQLRLIDEIKNWNHKTNLFGKNISSAAVAEIADNLQIFLDEVEKEGLDFDNLLAIDDGELASHKQQILKFLQYFGSVWQNILVKDGLISAAKNRNLLLKNYNEYLQKNGSKFPILAAGSTGSVSAAAELLKTIASLKNGRVILFGLDKNLDENIWQKITENHPQFMLKKLLDRMAVLRRDVTEIGLDQPNNLINHLISLATLPAEFIFAKQEAIVGKIDSLTKIETENEFEEAKIISILLLQALGNKNKNAALISNNKNLIQLVKTNLSAWQIEIDDSSSSNLADSKLASDLFLISEFASNNFSSINLLAVLKRFLTGSNSNFLKILETKIIRKVVSFPSFDELLLQAKDQQFFPSDWLQKIAGIFQPLIAEFQKKKIDFKKTVEIHFACFSDLQNLSDKEKFSNESDGANELLEFYQELSTSKSSLNLEPQSYPALLKNLLKNYQFRRSGEFHPRLHILSTIEARLMSYDLTIVSGLIEGQFPAQNSEDWLGNKIRSEFGLASSARKIGTSSYDFCNYLGNKKVFLFYPKNQNNAPTIKSRFLLKLETVLKINGWNDWLKDGSEYLEVANYDFQKPQNIQRPNPKPEQNLTRISATDISKWLRNPYYIYGKRILQLSPLQKIEQDASYAEFGNFVHKVLEEFVKNYPNLALLTYGKKIFKDYFPDPTSKLLWWEKFKNIAEWFLKAEQNLRENLDRSFVEVEAEMLVNGVALTTKIDRINLYLDGSLEIIDYKTGALPAPKDIKSGLEPQLAVEAMILICGKIKNYNELKIKHIDNLQYQNLKGKDQNKIKDLSEISELMAAAKDGVFRLIKIFYDGPQKIGYISCPNIELYKKDDYWHLGRVGE